MMTISNLAPFHQHIAIGSLLVGLCAVVVYLLAQSGDLNYPKYKDRLPPGPPAHWLFGNTPPLSHAYLHYSELAETYGPVFTLRYGSRLVCVIGRHQAATDIMVKQSHNLADRPHHIAAGELISDGMRVVIVGVGERLRKFRNALHAMLTPQKCAAFEIIQSQHARNFVLNILNNPAKHVDHARQYAASVIMSVAYGKTTPTLYSDPEVVQINQVTERLGYALRPGAYIVDMYPFLKYIPYFTSELKRFHREEITLYRSQVNEVMKKRAKNEAQPCFVTFLLEHQDESGLSDDELAYLAGSMFAAGSDTTGGVLAFMVMAAACHPEAQRRVQAQLDAVVGHNRIPTYDDVDSLPEVWAFIEELYRWRPVVPNGMSHRATKDIFWKDYVIPAGTEVVGCHWAIARDPDVFPDPEAFKPFRWLNKKGQMREDLKFFSWGFGRRICPGQHLADRSVFINTALTLWAFEISEDPAHSINTMAIKDGALAHPYDFVARFKPRVHNLREKLTSNDIIE